MKIEILKTPHSLTREELSSILKKATGFKFPDYCIEELAIQKDTFVSFVSVMCIHTGFTMALYKDYSIKIDGYSKYVKNTNLIDMFEVLLENEIIKIN